MTEGLRPFGKACTVPMGQVFAPLCAQLPLPWSKAIVSFCKKSDDLCLLGCSPGLHRISLHHAINLEAVN